MESADPGKGKAPRADDSYLCQQQWFEFDMLNYLLIMLGGALGTGARFLASGLIAERAGEFFPLGTLLVNVSGSFLVGVFAGLVDPAGAFLISARTRQFLMIGFCGGYTTFSSFSLQTLELAHSGDWLKASANVLLSVVCCLLAVWLGRAIGWSLASR